MGKKLTKEEFIRRVAERNEHVRNGEVEILGDYISASDRIECICHIHNITWSPFAASLYKGIGCIRCKADAIVRERAKTNETFQEELETLRKQDHDAYTDDVYINCHTKLSFYCSKGHRWYSTPSDILNGYGCPYCSGLKVIIGETSLWDTRPDVAMLLEDPQNGYKYSAGSDKRVGFVCPICKTVHQKTIGNVCRYGFICSACSDKVSYPQKFARALLKQLPVQNVKYEYAPDWLKPYRFDAYFEHLGNGYVLEMDGHIGHGNRQFGTAERDVDGYIRDVIKDSLALEHDIQVIRIDCRYQMNERFEYVQRNIVNSRLNNLFDLSNIDWVECDTQGQEKLVPKVAELYNNGLSLSEIQNLVGHHKKTIGRWLKQANNIGLCNYDTKEARIRGRRYYNNLNNTKFM